MSGHFDSSRYNSDIKQSFVWNVNLTCTFLTGAAWALNCIQEREVTDVYDTYCPNDERTMGDCDFCYLTIFDFQCGYECGHNNMCLKYVLQCNNYHRGLEVWTVVFLFLFLFWRQFAIPYIYPIKFTYCKMFIRTLDGQFTTCNKNTCKNS